MILEACVLYRSRGRTKSTGMKPNKILYKIIL